MTKEDKDLLLKYLYMALPYGIKLFKVNEPESAFELYSIDKESGEIKYYKYRGKSLEIGDMARLFRTNDIPRFKPYLCPMSSMTEEEEEELRLLKNQLVDCDENNDEKFYRIISEIHNLYLSHHIDFMNLIPKGLAIKVTKDNNPYK